MGSGKRPMLGKQKIEMKKIENEEARQVCFSKRRAGIFKKANELCTLCGAEIAVIVFSPAGKSFSFGHPNVESIVERFLPDSNTQQQSKVVEFSSGEVETEAHLLARRHAEVMARLEDERLRRDYLKEQMKEKLSWVECSHSWMKEDLQNLDMEQLEQYEDALNEIKKKVHRRSEELLVESSNSYYRALAGIEGNSLSNWTNYYHVGGNQQMQNPMVFNGVRGNGFF